jgi:hypothetical protein
VVYGAQVSAARRSSSVNTFFSFSAFCNGVFFSCGVLTSVGAMGIEAGAIASVDLGQDFPGAIDFIFVGASVEILVGVNLDRFFSGQSELAHPYYCAY